MEKWMLADCEHWSSNKHPLSGPASVSKGRPGEITAVYNMENKYAPSVMEPSHIVRLSLFLLKKPFGASPELKRTEAQGQC